MIRSFRNEMFAGYKTEEGMPPELLAQFPLMERALEAIGVVTWGMIEFEADDAMATAALRWADDVEQVVLLSPDKDMTQCVIGDRVVCYDRRRQILIDEQGVVAKFGVQPESIPDYLALVGDTADGVPGIPGWGPRSASTLLAKFGRVDRIPDDPKNWGVQVRGAGAPRCLVGGAPRGGHPVPDSDHAAAGCPAGRVTRRTGVARRSPRDCSWICATNSGSTTSGRGPTAGRKSPKEGVEWRR